MLDSSDIRATVVDWNANEFLARALAVAAFAGVWILLFGTGAYVRYRADDLWLAVYSGVWLLSPLLLGAWLVVRRDGRWEYPLRLAIVAMYGGLAAVYWVYYWGQGLFDAVGSTPMELARGAMLILPAAAIVFALARLSMRQVSS